MFVTSAKAGWEKEVAITAIAGALTTLLNTFLRETLFNSVVELWVTWNDGEELKALALAAMLAKIRVVRLTCILEVCRCMFMTRKT